MNRRLALIYLTICSAIVGKQLSFEENAGQSADREARFLARTASRWNVFILGDGSLRFISPAGSEVAWSWIGANSIPDVSPWRPAGPVAGATSYCLGNDKSRWIQNVRSYSRIERKNLYPGIDLVLYGAEGELEYDLVVHPGADPSQIRLHVTRGSLDGLGNINADGLFQRAPSTYQITPSGERTRLKSNFVSTAANGIFRLEIPNYRHDLPLIIDPIIRGQSVFAGDREDVVVAVFPYAVVGYTRSSLWNRPAGSGDADIFIRTEHGGSSTTVYWGGSGDDIPTAALVDQSSRFYIAGYTDSRDFPIRGQNAQATFGGGATDGFFVTGNEVSSYVSTYLSTYVGGSGDDRLTAVAISSDGSVAFAGETTAATRPFGSAIPYLIGPLGGVDILVGLFDPNGLTVTSFGGQADDHATAMTSLGDGIFAVAGYTSSTDFPISAGAYQTNLRGGTDGWLAKMKVVSGQPAAILNATYWGGSMDDRINALVVGFGKELIAAGATSSPDFPALGAAHAQLAGPSDGFVSRFNTDTWLPTDSGLFGGSGDDTILALTRAGGAGGADDIVVGGSTTSQDLQVPGNAIQDGFGGGTDGFVAQLDRSGAPVWASYAGGSGDDRVVSLALRDPYPLTGGGSFRIGGNTSSTAWLSALDSTYSGSGPGGFAIDVEINRVVAGNIIIGKDLQAALTLAADVPLSSDGVFTVRSSDPAKLLLAVGQAAGNAQVAYPVNAPLSATPIYAQALASSGVVDVIVSGRGIPQRILKVQLAPSAITVMGPKTVQRSLSQRVFTGSVQASPLDAATGQPLPPQEFRFGLDPALRLVSSDDSGAHPQALSPLTVDLLTAGSFVLTPVSSVFNTFPGEKVTLSISAESPHFESSAYLYVPKGADVFLTVNVFGTLKFTSLDPSKVLIRDGSGVGRESVILAGPGVAQILSDVGFAAVQIDSADGTPYQTVYLALGRPIVDYHPQSLKIPVGGVGSVYGQLSADGKAPDGYSPKRFPVPGVDFFTPLSNQLSNGPAQLDAIRGWDQTQIDFRGIHVGKTSVTLPVPNGVSTLSPPNVTIEVTAPSVTIGADNDLVLGEGYYRYFAVQWSGAADAGIQLDIADTSVAQFPYSLNPGRLTLNSRFYVQLPIEAKGKAGQSTTITATMGGNTFVATFRILPVFLQPVETEIKVRGPGLIDLAPTVFDPKQAKNVSAGILSKSPQTINVQTDASNQEPCVFSQTADPGPSGYTLSIACYGQGAVIARFSSPGGPFIAPPRNASIRVQALNDAPVPSSTRVYVGNQMQLSLLANGAVSTITSSDPSKVLLSVTPGGPGSASIQTDGRYYVRGYASDGRVRLTLDHSDTGLQDEVWVFLMPSTIWFDRAIYDFSSATPSNTPVTLSLGAATLTQDLLPFPYPGDPVSTNLRSGTDPFAVKIVNDNPSVAALQPPTPILSDTASHASVNVKLFTLGEAHLSVAQPDGFTPTPGATIRVSKPRLTLREPIILAKDLQQAVSFSTSPDNSTLPAQLTVTSLDPDLVVVSANPSVSGTASVVVTNTVYVQALAGSGTARLRVSGLGIDDFNTSVEFLPAALVFDSPLLTTRHTPGSSESFIVRVAPVRGSQPASGYYQTRPDVLLYIRLRSDNPDVVTVAGSGEQRLTAGSSGTNYFGILYQKPGSAQLTLETDPSVPTLPGVAPSWKVEVAPWSVYLRVASPPTAFLVSTVLIDGPDPRVRPGGLLSASPDGAVLFSLTASSPGAASLQVPGTATSVYMTPVAPGGTSVTLAYAAPETIANAGSVVIVPPQFIFNYPNGNITAPLSANTATARILLGAYAGDERPLAPGLRPVAVNIRSSNPAVAAPVASSVPFGPGVSRQDVAIKLLSKGSAILTIEPPAGFAVADAWRQIVVAVQ